MIERVAEVLESWATGVKPSASADEQIDLSFEFPEPISDGGPVEIVAEPVDHDHSSSSDLDLLNTQKKTGRVTVDPYQPLEPSYRRIYESIRDSRSVDLLPPEEMWADFRDWIIDKRKSYASEAGLRRRWRSWVSWQNPPIAPPAPAASPSSESPPPSSVRSRDHVIADALTRWAEAIADRDADVRSSIADGISDMLARGAARAPPLRAPAVA